MEFKPIETQEQFDEMVKERIERAKRSAVPEDYEDLKAKAARLDEIEEKNKTELQKAQEVESTLQTLAMFNESLPAEALFESNSTLHAGHKSIHK